MGKNQNSISRFIIFIIRGYQCLFSYLFGPCCRFHPTCSAYAIEAIQSQGYLRGCYLTARRILRCHPWHKGGMDPVPEKNHDAKYYD